MPDEQHAERPLSLDDVPADAPLAGVVVLEESTARSVRFAGRLLASYGATVVQVRGGAAAGDSDELTPGMAAYLDAGKLSVSFDPATPTGAQIQLRLEATADIVLRFVEPAQAAASRTSSGSSEGPVVVEVSWFGRTGPWAGYLCDDFLAQHASGMGFTSSLRVEDLANEGPRAVPGHLAEMVAGLAAATAAMAALNGRGLGGHPPDDIDISVTESIVSFMRYETVIYSYGWGLPSRSKQARSPIAAPVFQQQTADGYVDFLIMQEEPWRALLQVLGNPEWGNEEIFATHPLRSAYWDALEPLLQQELRATPTATIYEEGQRLGVAVAPVNSVAGAAAAPQFAERAFFVQIPVGEGTSLAPGDPFRLGGPVGPRPAPAPGQHNARVLTDWLGCSRDDLVAAGAAP